MGLTVSPRTMRWRLRSSEGVACCGFTRGWSRLAVEEFCPGRGPQPSSGEKFCLRRRIHFVNKADLLPSVQGGKSPGSLGRAWPVVEVQRAVTASPSIERKRISPGGQIKEAAPAVSGDGLIYTRNLAASESVRDDEGDQTGLRESAFSGARRAGHHSKTVERKRGSGYS